MLWRKPPRDIAKVGVEGSNPFARSRPSQLFQADKSGSSEPFLLRIALQSGALSRFYDVGGISPDTAGQVRQEGPWPRHRPELGLQADPCRGLRVLRARGA